MKMFIFCQRSKIFDRTEISTICDAVLTSFWVKEGKKTIIFRVWMAYSPHMSAPATPLKSATLWCSCFLKQHLLVLLPKIVDFIKTWKNSAPQIKLSVPGRGKQKFRQKFLSGGPRPICCQCVILLKSYS